MQEPAAASFRAKGRALLIYVAGFALSAILALATVAIIWTSHRAAMTEWRSRVSGLAQVIGAHAKQAIETSDDVLLDIVQKIEALDIVDSEEFSNKLENYHYHEELSSRIKGAPHINLLAFIDNNGYVINNSFKFTPPYLFTQWGALKADMLDAKVDRLTSVAFRNALTGELILGLGRKIHNKSGRHVGTIGAGVRAGYFSDFYRLLSMSDKYRFSLSSDSGFILASYPDVDDGVEKNTLVKEMLDMPPFQDDRIFIVDGPADAGQNTTSQRLVAQQRIAALSIIAGASVSSDVYLSQWTGNAIATAIGGGAMIILVLFLTFVACDLFKKTNDAREEAVAHAGVKTRFLSTMSHEIRTPLNAIVGGSELILGQNLSPETEKFAAMISRASKHLLFVINGVLDFSRLEAMNDRVEVSPFELRPVLEGVMDMAASLPGAENLSLRLSISEEVPRALNGDFSRMTQILLNLIGNAIKATNDGSVELEVSFNAVNGHIVLVVSDTGCGIPASEQARIFKPFERVRGAAAITEGTGLGLSICRRLTANLGGTIDLHSEPGVGTTFTVKLPMSPASADLQPAFANASVEASAALHLLVVEDMAANRMFIEGLLRKNGHVVQMAANGVEAVDAVKMWRFDAILMDVQMPEMDGIEATRIIRQMADPAGRTPIVGLTAFVEPNQHELMMAAGMDTCLTKPVQSRALLAALATISPSGKTPASTTRGM